MACLALAGLLGCMSTACAHPGGLDKQGCHTNRKTGEYHCHRGHAPADAASVAPRATPRQAPVAPSRLDGPTPARAFRNCDEARAHGAAPVRRGDPGYGPHLDRDNDGVGCEPYRGR
jgi:hypothetical protein